MKYFFYISISLFVFNFSLAQDVNIEENISLSFVCELEKKIVKNAEYNYQTFLAKDLEDKDLDKFEINAKQPKTLLINGLSSFLSKKEKLTVRIVNKDVVLFKAIDEEKNYSESGIINRKSGELIHEITRDMKSENSEKDISFYSCKKNEKKVIILTSGPCVSVETGGSGGFLSIPCCALPTAFDVHRISVVK